MSSNIDPAKMNEWLDGLVDLIEPKLEERGFSKGAITAVAPIPGVSAEYDDETCRRFLSREHISDRVLERAQAFFALLASQGEVGSLELVELLELKGPTSIPANLMNPLKKSARRLGIPEPWDRGENEEGTRTIWSDRDEIAGRMVHAIAAEKGRRQGAAG